jgi:hypothetical protein
LRVATTPALVACKFHALADRRGTSAEKRESDAVDLVRLVSDLLRDPEAIRALAASPFDLSALVAAQVQRWFADDALRTAHLAHLGGFEIEPAEVATLGTLFLTSID